MQKHIPSWEKGVLSLDVGCYQLLEHLSQQVLYRPNPIGESCFHRRCDSEGLMHPAKVVEREPKRVGRLQILPLFAEGVGEPSHPSHSHP